MYDFQSAMADGKARAQRERNRGSSSAVRIMTTEELYMGMTEDDWNDWQEEQASSVDDIEADMAIAELAGDGVDAPPPMRPKREPRNRKTAQPQTTFHPSAAKAQGMNGAQYVLALRTLGLTPHSAAPHLGISRAMSFRYAAGSHEIPLTIAKLLRALVKLGSVDV